MWDANEWLGGGSGQAVDRCVRSSIEATLHIYIPWLSSLPALVPNGKPSSREMRWSCCLGVLVPPVRLPCIHDPSVDLKVEWIRLFWSDGVSIVQSLLSPCLPVLPPQYGETKTAGGARFTFPSWIGGPGSNYQDHTPCLMRTKLRCPAWIRSR